jgi:hypothetical protein
MMISAEAEKTTALEPPQSVGSVLVYRLVALGGVSPADDLLAQLRRSRHARADHARTCAAGRDHVQAPEWW